MLTDTNMLAAAFEDHLVQSRQEILEYLELPSLRACSLVAVDGFHFEPTSVDEAHHPGHGRGVSIDGRLLHADLRLAARVRRELFPTTGVLVNAYLRVEAWARGAGIAPRLVLRSLRDAEHFGFKRLELTASLECGRAYWAMLGFAWASTAERDRVAQRITALVDDLPVPKETVDTSSPESIVMHGRTVPGYRLRDLGEAAGIDQAELDDLCEAHRDPTEVTLGEALMLLGPDWTGAVDLGSGHARRIEANAMLRLQRSVRRRSSLAG